MNTAIPLVSAAFPPVASSFIMVVRYRHSDSRLNVVLRTGLNSVSHVDYAIVPYDVYERFLSTDSFGKIYNSFVKGKFESVPHVDEEWPPL